MLPAFVNGRETAQVLVTLIQAAETLVAITLANMVGSDCTVRSAVH
jgi:hypothetical protein